uniref:Uncharacterized protein n=1 Tax=Glossina pallidipes TaxID=7398 RepID=A0A1A9ZI04_GLOPL
MKNIPPKQARVNFLNIGNNDLEAYNIDKVKPEGICRKIRSEIVRKLQNGGRWDTPGMGRRDLLEYCKSTLFSELQRSSEPVILSFGNKLDQGQNIYQSEFGDAEMNLEANFECTPLDLEEDKQSESQPSISLTDNCILTSTKYAEDLEINKNTEDIIVP